MNTEATARVTLPDNQTGSVSDLTIIDDGASQQTLWDFTAWDLEYQTLKGAAQLLRANGWRPADVDGSEATWLEADGRWTLSVERI